MKTKKNLVMLSILLIGMVFTTVNTQAQTKTKVETEKKAKEIKIKIEKDDNGKVLEIDTVITDLDNFDAKAFKEKYGVDVLIDDGMVKKEFIDAENAKTIEVFIEGDKEQLDGEEVEMNIFITDDGEEKVIKTTKGAKVIKLNCKGDKDCESKIVIKKIEGEEGEKMIFITDDMEVAEGGEGMEVINVESVDGEIIITTKIMIMDLMAEDKDVEESGLKDELLVDEGNKLEVSELKFYPNPSNGLIKFSFNTKSSEPVTINVFDLSGKSVYSETVTDFKGKYEREIDLSNMKKGVYFLKISQNNQTESKKIILN